MKTKFNLHKHGSKQINKNLTTLVRIDAGLHRLLKIKAAQEKTTIRTLIEGTLADLLSVEGSKGNKENFYE